MEDFFELCASGTVREVWNAIKKYPGININARDENGRTALMAAARNSTPGVVGFLLQNGADGQIKDHDGKRAIDYARQNKNLENTEACKELLKASGVDVKLPERKTEQTTTGAEAAGLTLGDVSAAGVNYGMDKFNTPRGHGFAAERANHLADTFAGKKTRMVGDDNAKYGADRMVDGAAIQSKYCNSGSKCVQECFKDGNFKYFNENGTPMQIEVPSDKYDAAVKAMEERISKGQVQGVTDPKEAKNIVRRGHFTYEQAKNIARFGTVESVTFDMANGVIIASYAAGISTALSFAVSLWNGEDFDAALRTAAFSGLKVAGTTFATVVLSSQLSRTALNGMLVGSSNAVVAVMGSKASAMLVNAFRSGANIYGAAAMKSAAKLLRGNAITGAVTFAVLSTVDIVNIFSGRISGGQLFKNLTNTASTVAGGTAGWVGGAAAGAAVGSVIPFVGTAVGGFVGGLLGAFGGGSVAGKVSNAVLDEFIEDDAKEMEGIIKKKFIQLSEDYLLNQHEAERVADGLKEKLTGSVLKDMYASGNRQAFAEHLLVPEIEPVVKKRKKITLPSLNQLSKGLKGALEELSDQQAEFA